MSYGSGTTDRLTGAPARGMGQDLRDDRPTPLTPRLRLGEKPLWVSTPMASPATSGSAEPVGAGGVPDHPPGLYRPPPSGGVNTSAIIGAFAVLGALVILIFLLLFGYRLL